MAHPTPTDSDELTVDALAAAAGTTTRSIRSLQTLGLLPRPDLRGRTGVYGSHHLRRLRAVLHLQSVGFSLQSLSLLFAAHERGESLGVVLGVADGDVTKRSGMDGDTDGVPDEAELYGFSDLQQDPSRRRGRGRVRGRPLLSAVPTTVWDETQAS